MEKISFIDHEKLVEGLSAKLDDIVKDNDLSKKAKLNQIFTLLSKHIVNYSNHKKLTILWQKLSDLSLRKWEHFSDLLVPYLKTFLPLLLYQFLTEDIEVDSEDTQEPDSDLEKLLYTDTLIEIFVALGAFDSKKDEAGDERLSVLLPLSPTKTLELKYIVKQLKMASFTAEIADGKFESSFELGENEQVRITNTYIGLGQVTSFIKNHLDIADAVNYIFKNDKKTYLKWLSYNIYFYRNQRYVEEQAERQSPENTQQEQS